MLFRTYRVPAMGLVAGVGFLASLAAFVFSFIPPSGFTAFSPALYPWIVGLVIIVLGAPPLIFYAVRKPSWDMRTAEDKSVPVTHEADPPAGADPGSAPATRRRPDAASGPPQTG